MWKFWTFPLGNAVASNEDKTAIVVVAVVAVGKVVLGLIAGFQHGLPSAEKGIRLEQGL